MSAQRSSALNTIWEGHRERVLERVDLLERAANELSAGALGKDTSTQARRVAHTLVGSVGTFGFIRASEVARAIEHEFLDPSVAQAPALAALVVELREELQRATPDPAGKDGPTSKALPGTRRDRSRIEPARNLR